MRGLVATEALQAGDVVLKVPIKACLTLQTAKTIRTRYVFAPPVFLQHQCCFPGPPRLGGASHPGMKGESGCMYSP
jgi:hypothetical protein